MRSGGGVRKDCTGAEIRGAKPKGTADAVPLGFVDILFTTCVFSAAFCASCAGFRACVHCGQSDNCG